MKKISEFIAFAHTQNTGLFGKTKPTLFPVFLSDYYENYQSYDGLIKLKFGELLLDYDEIASQLDTEDKRMSAGLSELQRDFNAFIISNRDYFKALFDTTQYEYNPIENYDQTEKETITDVNNQTNKTNYGQLSETNKFGNAKNITTNGTAPYDELMYQNYSNAVTNSEKEDDTFTRDSRTDSNEQNEKNTRNREFRRHGNIGITTTQQMIIEQRNVLINLIADILTQFIELINLGYEGVEYEVDFIQ